MISVHDPSGMTLQIPLALLEQTFGNGPTLYQLLSFDTVGSMDLDTDDMIVVQDYIDIYSPDKDVDLKPGMHVFIVRGVPDSAEGSGNTENEDRLWTRLYLGEEKDPPNRKCFPGHFKGITEPIIQYIGKVAEEISILVIRDRGSIYFTVTDNSPNKLQCSHKPYLRLSQAMKAVEEEINY
jgi:hypothetical protein